MKNIVKLATTFLFSLSLGLAVMAVTASQVLADDETAIGYCAGFEPGCPGVKCGFGANDRCVRIRATTPTPIDPEVPVEDDDDTDLASKCRCKTIFP